jgi:hypothetical protein
MVQMIQTIDAIARERGADVVFLAVHDETGRPCRRHPELDAVTRWLESEGFAWRTCAAFETGMIHLEGGPQVIFIDTPFIPGSPVLSRLESYFEEADGRPRIPGLVLTCLPLEVAMTHADHDAPTFWENP